MISSTQNPVRPSPTSDTTILPGATQSSSSTPKRLRRSTTFTIPVGAVQELTLLGLDLRRPELASVMGLRHRVSLGVRTYLNGQGFWEIETPMLARSTHEGAIRPERRLP